MGTIGQLDHGPPAEVPRRRGVVGRHLLDLRGRLERDQLEPTGSDQARFTRVQRVQLDNVILVERPDVRRGAVARSHGYEVTQSQAGTRTVTTSMMPPHGPEFSSGV
jgi:hypothetical protein